MLTMDGRAPQQRDVVGQSAFQPDPAKANEMKDRHASHQANFWHFQVQALLVGVPALLCLRRKRHIRRSACKKRNLPGQTSAREGSNSPTSLDAS
jgi:hypothetical protein